MEGKVFIPIEEYKQRTRKAAALMKQKGLDILIVNSNEADFSNVRYFSRFWPLFETAGVAINQHGHAALMAGPVSEIFGKDKGILDNVFAMLTYRESADPAYPEFKASVYTDVLKHLGIGKDNPRIGIGGWLVTTVLLMDDLKKCYPKAEIVRADHIMTTLRQVKSKNEIACIREALRITELAQQAVIKAIKPGMTELQLVGIAQQCIYENGAEYEGLPHYVFSESSSRHAISRPGYKKIGPHDVVQLNMSARIDGYSPSIGIPVSMGKLTQERRDIIQFCLDNHRWTQAQLKPGVIAATVAQGYYQRFVDAGREKNFVYGPCHGTGMIEVEPPWMESNSQYPLVENMTFEVDTFISADTFGARWENVAVLTPGGSEFLATPVGTIFEIE